MPNFQYEAAGSDGSITRGLIEASTRSVAVEKILGQGKTPVRVVEDSGARSSSISAQRSFLPQFSLSNDRVGLLQEFGILLKAGLSVERALTTMQVLAEKPRIRLAIQNLLDGLRGGEPLSSAMKRADMLFPDPLRKLVAAGEASGKLSEVMARLAEGQTRAKVLTDRIVSAMIYPALLVVVMISVLVMIFTTVLPRLEPMFSQSGAALPWPAAALLGVSHFINDFGYALAAAMIAALFGILYLARQPWAQLAIDRHILSARYLLKLPLHYQGAQFCRNLSMLVDGGMPLNRALEITQEAVSNQFVKSRLTAAIARVKHGRSLKSSLEEANAFPRVAIEFVAVGEETGRLGAMLSEAAEILDRDVQIKLDRLSGLLLPAVTIILGLIVAGIMSGVVSGILAANDLAV
ncbi:MAG: type II secretion system F family protein [Micropepsaceae bacterium]